jgi:Peptidase family M1 domain
MDAVNLRFALPLALLLCAVPAYGQGAGQPVPPDTSRQSREPSAPDGVAQLLNRLEQLLQHNNRDEFPSLLSTPELTGAEAEQATDDLFSYETIRAAVKERDRTPLEGSLPGDGYSVIVELMTETAARARVLTARFDVRRPRGGAADSWRIAAITRLTFVQGLYRLRIDASTQYVAREFTIRAQDAQFTLHSGYVFQVLSGEGVTGLVLLGRGEMKFAPTPQTEKGQLRIFSGNETLTTLFGAAFVRMHPADYETRVDASGLRGMPADPRQAKRAQDVFAAEAPKSFNIDLRDLSRETWYILPQSGDFLAEIRTNKFGTLTYSRSGGNAEDVTLFDRARKRAISLYASPSTLAIRGATYNEDDLRTYDVIDYNIDTVVYPDRQFIEGRTHLTLRVQADAAATLTMRLAEPLAVTSVISSEFGRLLFFRIRNDESLIINLPVSAQRGTVLALDIAYSGRVPTQGLERETVALEPQQGDDTEPDSLIQSEPNFLLSSRSAWYPQNVVTDYARARIRVTVPEGYGCVASGQLTQNDVSLRDAATQTPGRAFVFNANQPVRYFAVVVSRLTHVTDMVVNARDSSIPIVATYQSPGRAGVEMRRYDRLAIAVEANPRQIGRGRDIAPAAADIMRFYGTLIDDTPYESLTVTMLEHDVPGGHSPAYFAIINNAAPFSKLYWGNDPSAFAGVPEFFLAHELAHQWWGQAIGWKNYHEQWISEGFAQYFSALYAQRAHGDASFNAMLRQFRRWSLSESDQGPVDLGYRLGLIQGQGRIFRAVIYNKGASVLHMLRRFVGDEAFFNGLRRFYGDQKFQKAGTDDFERAMETASGRSLDRFFDRWIRGSDIPTLRYSSTIQPGEVLVQFDQDSRTIFDVPVTVTLQDADGRLQDVIVPVSDAHVEQRIPTRGTVRDVQINRDSAALARFSEFQRAAGR